MLYFRGGHPFTDLPQNLEDQIDRSVLVRNAIAHKSRHSQEKFQKRVLHGTSLPPRQRTVAGFLRDIHAYNPIQTRCEVMIAQLLAAARKLAR